MELKDAIKNRHSVRRYSDEKPSKKLIEELIEYANLAPSAGNLQARDFIIVDDKRIQKDLYSAAFNQNSILEAPLILVICANLKRILPYGKRGKELYCLQDVAASIEHILLFAVDTGLDTCWIGAFDEKSVSKILKLPSYSKPVALITIGYSPEKKTITSRFKTDELIHYNQW
jgi:nitroreductase